MRSRTEANKGNPYVGALISFALTFCLLLSSSGYAESLESVELGFRAGFSGAALNGNGEFEHFQSYDVLAVLGLPWGWYTNSGWGVRTRVQFSAGVLTAAGTTGGIFSVLPGLSFGKKDGFFEFNMGVGPAVLSKHHFGEQTLGGPFQIAWDTDIKFRISKRFKIGYTFHHMSDAGVYNKHEAGHGGVDLHSIVISYEF